jgi:hypothetical protein
MVRYRREFVLFATAVMALGAVGPSVRAQQAAPAAAVVMPSVQLKIDVVISRSQGARKISSLPYSLVVPATPAAEGPKNVFLYPQGQTTQLRVGVDAYTGRTYGSSTDGKTSLNPEYQYIGTSIDCRADIRGGAYGVYINLSDSAILTPAPGDSGLSSVQTGIRRFSASNLLIIKDGQSAQLSSGTDPISGDTIRVDVTATAIK